MTALDSYSPLESLLLFQALSAFGTHADAFGKVSESLRKCTALQRSSSDDDSRFEPDSLKDLYVSLLKEDAKQELQRNLEADDGLTNGDGPSNPRKRKIGSPNLRTVEDASQHAHLVPKTVARLYANYQEHIIKEIKADERTFDRLAEETSALEQQESQASTKAATVSNVSQESVTSGGNAPEAVRPESAIATQSQPDEGLALRNDDSSISPSLENEQDTSRAKTKIDDIINHDVQGSQELGEQSSPETGSTQPQPPDINKQKPLHIEEQQPPPLPAHTTPSSASQPSSSNYGPSVPSQVPQPSPYDSSSAVQHVPPPPASEQAGQLQSSLPSVSLPPPQGAARTSLPPVAQYSPKQDTPANQGGTASISPSYAQQYMYNQGYPTFPSQPNYQQHYPHPYPQSQPPVVPLPPPKGGVLLQPFQVTPQAPSPSHQFPRPAPATTPGQRPPSKQAASILQGRESPLPNDQHRHPPTGHTAPRTPMTVPGRRNARPPGTTNSPGSATAWKLSIPATVGRRPLPEEISPVDEDQSLFRNDADSATSRETIRPGPSQPKGRRRSRSSATDDMGIGLSIPGGRRVKHEPTTPMSTGEQDVYQTAPKPLRNSSFKRKQEDGELYEDEMSPPGSPRRDPHTVVAYKNFDKMTQHLLENITSHKLAGIFANPVKDRDAEGYSDMIRRPQDLKSIKNAIRAGSKAVAQASIDVLQSSPGPGGSGGIAGTVALPFSDDLVPPKGIVNPAQLECELMRVFANAVMFNPGDDEVVQDTREMFEDVEQIISSWRSTEKAAERQESAEAVEESGASVKKRRT